MLYDELLDNDNPHIKKLIRAFQFLDRLDFSDDMASFFESLRGTHPINQFEYIDDISGCRIHSTHVKDSKNSEITNLFYKENNPKQHYNDGVIFIFNDKRLLSLKCTITDDVGDPEYWILYFTSTKIIQENDIDVNFKYSHLKEHKLQYDTVCPLVSYFLEYGDRV